MKTDPQTIRYGMFIMPFHPPEKPTAQCYDEDLELIVRAEELGFAEFWIGEHHTMRYENIVMPEIFIGRALGETRRIRLGPAPVCLQQHHPAHVACRLAMLDHLSKGRLNLCFGAGSVTADQELYGCEPKHAAEMVDEAIEMILKLWASEPPYEIAGRFWNVSVQKHIDREMGLGSLHKPLQKPHPPIAVPSISPRSPGIERAAARGFSLFSHHMIAAGVLREQWATYRAAASAAGRVASCVACRWRSEQARPTGSLESPGAASRPPRWRSCDTCRGTDASPAGPSASTAPTLQPCRRGTCAATAPARCRWSTRIQALL